MKAPWTYRVPPEDVPHVEYWIDNADGVPIADIKSNGNPEEYARLIASAPDLLAFVQDVATWLIAPDAGYREEFQTRAKTLIAKATQS